MINQGLQFNLGAFPCGKGLVKSLLLPPKLLKFSVFKVVKPPYSSLICSFISLAYPFRIVSAIFEVDLELTDTVSPMV